MSYLSKKIVVVDLDGTVADPSHRLHHVTGPNKDWDAFYEGVEEDGVYENIAELVRRLSKSYDILYATGRREEQRDATLRWLEKNDLDVHFCLRMRPPGCNKKDHEIKPAMIENIADDVFLILEDRSSVVAAYRELGYTCIQVKDGDY